MTKELFTPTVRCIGIFNAMSNKEKQAVKLVVDTIGYYGCIQFLQSIAGGDKTEKLARDMADIGLNLETFQNSGS